MIKKWFYGLSIAHKLRIVLTMGSLIALVCFGLTYTYFGVVSLRSSLIAGAENTANIMGSSLVASLRFDNPDFATEKLKSLNPDGSYKQVCVYKNSGEVFANYPGDIQCQSTRVLWNGTFEEKLVHTSDGFAVVKNILADGQIVGAIQVVRSEEAITQYLLIQTKTITMVAGACLLIFYIIANYLQKVISKPIVDIATHAELISIMHNFDGRLLSQSSQDEIGQIAQAFNSVVSLMNNENKRLQLNYDNIRKAHNLTLKKLEEIVEEFSEPADAFLVYAHMAAKEGLDPKTEAHLEYQKDVMDSISEYHIRASSTSRITNLYYRSINEPLIQLGLKEYIAKYQNDLKGMMPHMPIEISGQLKSHEKPVITVYKSAWDELFRLYSQLLMSMVSVISFPAKLHCTLPTNSSELALSLINQNIKSASSSTTIISLCELSIFEDGTAYTFHTIDDPDAADSFLDDAVLPRKDVKFILDSIGYIANANNIVFHHYFGPDNFTIYLKLNNLKYAETHHDHLKVCQ